jgi:polyhydroxyalkanoate synthesis regulator phasin
MNEDDIIKKVTLLGVLKKQHDETLNDVMLMLVDTGMYDLKEAKQVFKELKADQYIANGQLTLKGITAAKEAEQEFKQ